MFDLTAIVGGGRALDLLAFIGGLGPWEIAIIVIVVLLLFGGKKIPELAKGIGRGMREFKKEIHGVREDFERALDEEDDDYAPPRPRKRRRRKVRPAGEAPTTSEPEPAQPTAQQDAPGPETESGAETADTSS